MKKYQILQQAMRDFPYGTKYHWPGDTNPKVFTSSGVFYFDQEGMITEIRNEEATVFNGKDWATIIQSEPEPLRIEKIAIRVNNEREFKFLMQHYDSLGWKSYGSGSVNDFTYAYDYIAFHDGFFHNTEKNFESAGYKIIDFDFFCAQKGLTPPKYIMDSVDGVPLYEGDKYCKVHRDSKYSEWYIFATVLIGITTNSDCIAFPDNNKAFSTKEAAEKWIEEQNKPKMILVSDDSQYPVEVYKNKIVIKCYGSDNHLDNLVVSGAELKKIVDAFYKLNGGQ